MDPIDALSPGLTEFTFWAYTHHENLNITSVTSTWRPRTLRRGRIQVVMASLAILQPQWRADRIKLIALNNKTRTSSRAVPRCPPRRSRCRCCAGWIPRPWRRPAVCAGRG